MKEYKYIIIGGGMTGSAAVMGIRKNDLDGSIGMFTREQYQPYNRPPLTKSLWDGKQVSDIIRPIEKYQINLFLETNINQINPKEKWVKAENGDQYRYEKLLISTGGYPIHLPDSPKGVIYYRTLKDFHILKEQTESKHHFCVIGGGFIGSEITAALTKNNQNVTMIFPETGISGSLFPDDLSEHLNDYYREKGVTVLNKNLVISICKNEMKYEVEFKQVDDHQKSKSVIDGVIVGVGIKPNVALAQEAGLDFDNGIIVNEFLQTNHPDIFSAGDVTNFKSFGLEKRMRVEHEDNANEMGMTAGLNMSGEMNKYDHLPFFYSDLFDLGYEAVGELNKDFEIHSDWIESYKKGTIFYLHQRKIRGIIFWNLWGKVDQGRDLIRKGKTFNKSTLTGLFKD